MISACYPSADHCHLESSGRMAPPQPLDVVKVAALAL